MDPVAGAGARPRRRGVGPRAPLTAVEQEQPAAVAEEALPARAGRGRHRAPAPAVPRLLTRSWTTVVPLLLLALGVWTRVFQWNGARSLWLDEALIARSLVSRGYVGLVAEPLQGEQAAPVLWLWASRVALDLFGDHERALRLVPLLGGLAALVLGLLLARRLLPAVLVPVAMALMVLSPTLLYFSNEVKPYSLDVAVVLGLLLLALRVPQGAGATSQVRLLAAAGAVAVWASFASVFALTGLSVALVLGALRAGGLRRAVPVALVLSTWVLSLGVSYVLVLHRLSDSEVLSGFWGYTFPEGGADLPAWLVRRAVDLTEDPLELFLWPLALLLLGIGTWRLVRHCRRPWLLATSAVPVALVAAALSAYPFASRLALWTVPLAAIALAAVVPHHLERGVTLMAATGALTLVAAPAAATTLRQTHDVFEVEELRPVMEQLAEQKQEGDLVLVDIPAKAPFDYYTGLMGLGRDGVILFATTEEVGGRCNDPAALRTGRFAGQRVWVVFAHPLADGARLGTREDMIARIEDVTNRRQVIQEHGAKAVLFDPTAPETGETGEVRNQQRCMAVVRTVPPTGTR